MPPTEASWWPVSGLLSRPLDKENGLMKKVQADQSLSYAKILPGTQTETFQKKAATQHPSPKKGISLSHSRLLLSSPMN